MSALSVSVVIPAYKAARTINRAVESVFGQTREPAEVLVVDDGSPDGADLAAALARYGDRVTLLRKPNGGAASARNHGIERARGSVIGFLDADDYWEPDKLERQLDLLDRHPEVGLTASRWYTEQPGEPRTPPSDPIDDVVDRAWAPVGPDVFRVACQVSTLDRPGAERRPRRSPVPDRSRDGRGSRPVVPAGRRGPGLPVVGPARHRTSSSRDRCPARTSIETTGTCCGSSTGTPTCWGRGTSASGRPRRTGSGPGSS